MQRSTQPIPHLETLNLQALTEDQHDALLMLSDSTTSFVPHQPCGNDYQLPNEIRGVHLDPNHLTQHDLDLLKNTYVCSDIINSSQLKRGHHYIAIRQKLNNPDPKDPSYEAVIICPINNIPVMVIQPTNLDESSKTFLHMLLTHHPEGNIFYRSKFYPLNINQSVVYVVLTENIVKFTRKKQNEFRYAIFNDILGRGNQGIAYKSTHTLTLSHANTLIFIKKKADDKARAIKILSNRRKIRVTKDLTKSTAVHEQSLMACFPGIFHTKPLAYDRDYDQAAIISRFFAGKELGDILFDGIPVHINKLQRIELCLKIAKNLQTLHDGDVIHRDIKPENVIATYDTNKGFDSVNIIDLGLGISVADASIGGGDHHGTAQYASPETFRGRNPTFASDIFSLGRLFMTIVSGFHISTFVRNIDEARAALMPEIIFLFPSCSTNSTYPHFINTLYVLLGRMNTNNSLYRIELPTIINELTSILEAAKRYYASDSGNNSTNTITGTATAATATEAAAAAATITSAATAALPTIGLFNTQQTVSKARVDCATFCSPTPTTDLSMN